jgi:hypothetical protein
MLIHKRRVADGHGDSMVKIPEIEKLGLVEWFEVRTHSRRLYVLLPTVDCAIHDIREGDKLRMKLEVHMKGYREKGGE